MKFFNMALWVIVVGGFSVFMINNISTIDDIINSLGRVGINEFGVLEMQQGYPRAL